jgi:hypothetical protein
MIVIRWHHLLILVASAACGSCQGITGLTEWADQNVGRPIAELRALNSQPGSRASRIGWIEQTYTLDNGNWVYIHPDSNRCELHFEVNPKGIIVGYRPVGEGCRYQ